MVLCKFFQQGSCRFGSKCHNEHFDIKQVIKTDVEAAINGKQWPLSTYGPFKDKVSIPSFIEDRSFEEVRLMCYEAKQKNYFEQFHQQFTKEAMDASNKMKALLQMTPAILDLVINVYDSPSTDNSTAKSNNPFGITGSQPTANAGSIFAKPANATNAAGGIFSSANTQAPFGSSAVGTNIFGAASNNQQSNSIFGGGSSVFSQPQQQQQQQQQTSIFGQAAKHTSSLFNNQQTQQASLFGQQAGNTGGNLFAQAQAQQQQTAPAGFGTFAPPQQQQQQQSSIFGQTQATTNVFGQQQALMAQPTQSTNIFAQAAAQVPAPQQQQQLQPGLFGQASAAMQQQNQNIFAQNVSLSTNMQAQASQPSSMQANAAGQGLFAQAAQQTQNIFNQQSMQQQPNTQQNIFQQAAIQNPNIPVGTAQPAVPAAVAPSSNLFNQAKQSQLAAAQNVSATVYSRMEDLTPEEIEAFKADAFEPGKLPFKPPPRELVN